MKTRKGIALNVGILEAITRLLLIIPAAPLAVLAIIYLHTYIFLLVPAYLIATGLTYYSPVKNIYRIAMHLPSFTDGNDPILSSNVM